jgi:hypothetical protein
MHKCEFFKWYFETIVIPFTQSCRPHLPAENRDDSFYLVIDGEAVQNEPIEDEEVCTALESAGIDANKRPASCSGTVGNACDRCNVFKATKKFSKGSKALIPADFEDLSLESALVDLITSKHPNISYAPRRLICKGLVKIVRSISSVMCHSIIAHGFERIGVAPLDTMKCLSNCAHDVLDSLGSEKLQEIAAKVPDLPKYFLDDNEGQLREGIMDNYDITRFETGDSRRTTDKDN